MLREQVRSYEERAFQRRLGASGFQSEAALGAWRVGAPERTHVRDGGRPAGQQRAVRSGDRDLLIYLLAKRRCHNRKHFCAARVVRGVAVEEGH